MAIYRRKPRRVAHHSRQGFQYTSIAFGKRCKEAGVLTSTGSVRNCFDNAMAESFNATLECELLVKQRFKNQREASPRSSTSSRGGITRAGDILPRLPVALARSFARDIVPVKVANKTGKASISPLAKELGLRIAPSDLSDALNADTVILAVPFDAAPQALRGVADWGGRIIVDATNATNLTVAYSAR